MIEEITGLKIIDSSNLRGKTVLLRVDLNVPLEKGKIKDDFKLRVLIPTFNLVFQQARGCVILTHLGRPEKDTPELSTKNLIAWFGENGFSVEFAKTIEAARNSSAKIILLENLRFFKGEEFLSHDFAQELAELGELFVFDAFGFIHRKTSSTSLLPLKFEQSKKFIGPLVARELEALAGFKKNLSRPYALLVGGAKLQKLEQIKEFIFLPPADRPNKILIGGFLAGWFYSSLEGIQVRIHFQEICSKNSVSMILPTDFIYFDERGTKQCLRAEKIDWTNKTMQLIDLGPESMAMFCRVLSESEKIFCNGTMGLFEQSGASDGTFAVLKAMSTVFRRGGTVAAGGGDTLRAIKLLGLNEDFNFLSSGGGASLATLGAPLGTWKNLPGLLEI